MNIDNKSGVIAKHLSILEENNVFSDDNNIERRDDESYNTYIQRALEEIVLNLSNNKYAKELFHILEIDTIFKIQKDKYSSMTVEVLYNDNFIPYRLDLKSMSTMGFSIGTNTSSSRQLTLAILAIVIGDIEALKYYQELSYPIIEEINSTRKLQISYLYIYKMYLELKREKMKNMVKYVCSELNITQKALSEKIGVSEGTVNRWSAKPDEIPLQTQKTLKILLENSQLQDNQKKLLKAISLIEEVKNTQNNSN